MITALTKMSFFLQGFGASTLSLSGAMGCQMFMAGGVIVSIENQIQIVSLSAGSLGYEFASTGWGKLIKSLTWQLQIHGSWDKRASSVLRS